MKNIISTNTIKEMKEITGGVSFFSSGYFYILELFNVAHINDGIQIIAAVIGLYWVSLKVKREKLEIESIKNKREKEHLNNDSEK